MEQSRVAGLPSGSLRPRLLRKSLRRFLIPSTATPVREIETVRYPAQDLNRQVHGFPLSGCLCILWQPSFSIQNKVLEQ